MVERLAWLMNIYSPDVFEDEEPAWLIAALNHVSKLTRQQLKVLRCLASGMDNKRIARTIECSDRTVKLHATEAVRRLGVESRLQAALVGHHLVLTKVIELPDLPLSSD
jgi:DNA-binding NarL/FixJ family response regulator